MSEKFISYDNLKQYDEFLDKELQDIKQHVDEGFTFNVKYAESDEIGGAAIKAVSDETGENIAEHFKTIENDVAINKTTVGYQIKNLIKYITSTSRTVNGVAFKVNSDNSITLNGTATSSTDFYIYGSWGNTTPVLSEPQIYTISMGNAFSNSGIKAFIITNGTWAVKEFAAASTNWTVTDDVASTHITCLMIRVPEGTTVNNITLYPMIRYSFITDDTYEPYVDDVDTRITDSKNDIAINKSTLGYQKKNLLNNFYALGSAHSWGNVSWNTNSDRSITVKGTASGSTDYPIGKAYLTEGKYIFTTSSPMKLHLYNGTNTSIIQGWSVNSSQTITITESNNYVLRIFMSSGDTHDTTFYFMLRNADITDDTYEPYVESVDERLQNFIKSGSGAKAGLVPAPSTTAGTTKYLREDGTWQVPPDTNTDTKNTAGSTNSSSKLFLIGATSQAANPQTYSHDTAYVGTDGCLYSNNTKVLTVAGGTVNNDVNIKFPRTSDDRYYNLGFKGLSFAVPSTAAWSAGINLYKNDGSTSMGVLGAHGTGEAISNYYMGTSYSDPLFKLDTSGNGTFKGSVTATSFSGKASSATKLATARTIDGVSFNGSANITHYGTCSTAAETQAKDVALSGFSLVTGARISVKFSNTNSADNITLNVNGTGAKPVFYVNSKMTAKTLRLQGTHVYGFVYDGTNWVYEGDSSYSSQNVTTTNADYRILLSHTDDDITERGVARKSSKFTANPSTGVLSAKSFKSIDTNLIASGSVKIPSVSNDSPQNVIITPENFNGNYYSSLVLTLYNAYGGVASVVLPMNYLLASTSNYIYVPVHFYSSSDNMFMYRPMYMLIQATSTNITLQTPYDGEGYWDENYNNFTYRLYKI